MLNKTIKLSVDKKDLKWGLGTIELTGKVRLAESTLYAYGIDSTITLKVVCDSPEEVEFFTFAQDYNLVLREATEGQEVNVSDSNTIAFTTEEVQMLETNVDTLIRDNESLKVMNQSLLLENKKLLEDLKSLKDAVIKSTKSMNKLDALLKEAKDNLVDDEH